MASPICRYCRSSNTRFAVHQKVECLTCGNQFFAAPFNQPIRAYSFGNPPNSIDRFLRSVGMASVNGEKTGEMEEERQHDQVGN